MPNTLKLISRIARKISEGEDGKFLATTLDFDMLTDKLTWTKRQETFA